MSSALSPLPHRNCYCLPRGRRVQTTGQKCNKFVKIVEFHYHIRNHHEKCTQISTSMPSIGLVIPEITCEMLDFLENKYKFAQ